MSRVEVDGVVWAGDVPQSDCLVLAARHQPPPPGGETRDGPRVTGQPGHCPQVWEGRDGDSLLMGATDQPER